MWLDLLIDTLLVIYVLVCALMGLVIMMQRSKQEGLGAAFGGGFTGEIWGAQTSQVLVKATVVLAASFFILSIALAHLYNIREANAVKSNNSIQQELLQPATPTAIAPAATSSSNALPAVTPAPVNNAAPALPVSPVSSTTPAKSPAK